MIRKIGFVALLGLLFVGFFSASASAYEHGGFRGGNRAPVRRVEPARRWGNYGGYGYGGYGYGGYDWNWRHHHRYNPYYRAW